MKRAKNKKAKALCRGKCFQCQGSIRKGGLRDGIMVNIPGGGLRKMVFHPACMGRFLSEREDWWFPPVQKAITEKLLAIIEQIGIQGMIK